MCDTKFSCKSFLAKFIVDITDLTPWDILRVMLHMEEESPLFKLFNWLCHGSGRLIKMGLQLAQCSGKDFFEYLGLSSLVDVTEKQQLSITDEVRVLRVLIVVRAK